MTQTNQNIRKAAAGAGVKLWQIADKLGYTDSYFSRLLRKELPEDKQAQIMQIIADLEQEAENSQIKKGHELRFVPGHDSNISEEQKEEISAYIDFLPEKRQENQDIVRCNECVNYHEYKDWDRYCQESFTTNECKMLKRDFGADGYCSLGRRKKAANETD